MTRLAVRTLLMGLILLLDALAFAHTPSWGDAAYDAEVAIYSGDVLEAVVRIEVGSQGIRYAVRDAEDDTLMDASLPWSDGAVTAWMHDGDGFEPADALAGSVLSALVDLRTTEHGACSAPGVRCEVEGEEEEVADRATRRMSIEQPVMVGGPCGWT